MRLRQLARKLQVQPKQLIAVLSKNGHEIENDPNFKLTEAQEALILKTIPLPEDENIELAKEAVIEAVEVPKEVVEEVETPTEEIVTPKPKVEAPKEKKPAKTKEVPKVYSLEKEEQEKHKDVELIKAPKLKLEGLKVLGKIDLPEPKVKEKTTTPETDENKEKGTQRKAAHNRTNNRQDRKRQHQRSRPNSVELERRKAEKEAKQKKQAEEKRLKELKAKHYKETVQAKLKAQNPKKKKTQVAENKAPTTSTKPSKHKPQAQKPKKGLRKLWAWLNGELDKF